MRDKNYLPKPARREYIAKKNSNKKRPLVIQSGNDKLVQEVVKMILEGEIKKEVSSKLIDLPEKYKIISSGGDILYLESPLSDSVFGFWETRGIVSSGSTMYIYSCQEENQLKKIIRKQPKETIIPAIFPIFKIPFNKKGSKKIIKLMIKNISNKYFIIFIVSPTWIHSNKK